MRLVTVCLTLTFAASCTHAPNVPQAPGGAAPGADPNAAAAATLVSKPGSGPIKIGGGQPGTTTPLPMGTDLVTSTGVPVSISLQSIQPDASGGAPSALQSAGAIQMSGTLPVRYRIDFAAPPGHEAECPASITGVASVPLVPFTATLRQPPAVAERYTIDVVVTVLDGKHAGTRLQCTQGLVVYPDRPETGKRGSVASP